MNTAQSIVDYLVKQGWDSSYLDEFDIPDDLKKAVKNLLLPEVRPRRSKKKYSRFTLGREARLAIDRGIDPKYSTLKAAATPNQYEDGCDIRFDWYAWFPNYGNQRIYYDKSPREQLDILADWFEKYSDGKWICPGCNRERPKERFEWVIQRARIPTCRRCARYGIKGQSIAEVKRAAAEARDKTRSAKERERIRILELLWKMCGKPPRCQYCRRYIKTEEKSISKRWVFKPGYMPACRKCWNEGKRNKLDM